MFFLMCIVHHLISESGPTYHDIFFEGNFKTSTYYRCLESFYSLFLQTTSTTKYIRTTLMKLILKNC